MNIPADADDPVKAFFLVAAICALVMLWMLVHAFFPKLRPNWCWEERSDGTPVSTVGYVAHAIAAALWAFAALAAGLRTAPIAGHGIWFVFLGLFVTIGVGLYDRARTRDDRSPRA
jgi:hypothetical protein